MITISCRVSTHFAGGTGSNSVNLSFFINILFGTKDMLVERDPGYKVFSKEKKGSHYYRTYRDFNSAYLGDVLPTYQESNLNMGL